MAKLTLNDISTGYQAQSTYNANNDAIETAFENTLSRDGTSPNQMSADIDLNSNDLLNVNNIDTQVVTIKGSQLTIPFTAIDGNTRYYDTLALAVTDIANVTIGDVIVLKERVSGVGGGMCVFDAVDATLVTEDEFSIVTGNATVSLQLRVGEYFNVAHYGDITGSTPATDTATIQAAFDAAVAANKDVTIVFPQDIQYAVNQVTVNSDYDLNILAYGAAFKLHFSGGAAFTLRGSNSVSFGSKHKWSGGFFRPSSTDSAHLPRCFDFTQTTNFTVSLGHTLKDVRAQDVYQFAYFNMDNTTYVGGSNFRHTLISCVSEVRTNLIGVWPNGYGVHFDGTDVNDSAGNDSRLIECKFLNHAKGIITNGSRTTFSMGSIDGNNCVGIKLDGAANFCLLNSYLEFLDPTFEYVNSPTDPFIIGNQLPVTLSSGTLGAGNFGKELMVANTGVTQNELNALTCNSNTGTAVEGITATGTCANWNATGAGNFATFEDNGSEIAGITLDGGIATLQSATSWQTDFPVMAPKTDAIGNLGSSTNRFNKIRTHQMDLVDGITAPTTVAGLAQIYVDTADGDLKVKFGDGTVKTITTDT